MSDTPRTSSKWEELCCSGQSWYRIAEYMKEDCQDLERELTAVTEQRDRLAEALKEYREALSDGPENCSYKMYEAVDEFAEKTLASVQDEQ